MVIVSHDEGAELRATVEAMRATMPAGAEIVVVDDASADGSADFLTGERRGVRLLRTERPLGVAGARNAGAALARGDVLVFSDAHVRPPDGWAAPLMRELTSPQVGAAGPALTTLGDPSACGVGFTWAGPDLVMRWLRGPARLPHAVPFLGGAFVALRRTTFRRTGGFDGGCVGWGLEDAELSLRLWRLGYEVRAVPEVAVGHLFRGRFPYAVDWRRILHNVLRVAALHLPPPAVARVVDHYAGYPRFAEAFAAVAAGDMWERRRVVARDAVRDGRSVLEQFGMAALL